MNHLAQNINGIVSVVNTPFTQDDTIDTASLRRHVNHSIKCGVVGFLVTALAAEVYKLSFEERIQIVRTIVDEVKGRVPVIGGTAVKTDEERLNYIKTYTQLGCDGILVIVPFDDEKSFVSKILEAAELIDGFMMIQDWDFQGYGIPIRTITKLFNEVEKFKSLKIEVVPAGMKYAEVLNATGGKLHVAGGWAGNQMIEALDRGVNAFMPTILLNVYNKIYNLHRDGKRNEAIDLFNRFLPVLSFSHQHLDISVHFNKMLSKQQGLFSTSKVREPILPYDSIHLKITNELIQYGINLSNEVGFTQY